MRPSRGDHDARADHLVRGPGTSIPGGQGNPALYGGQSHECVVNGPTGNPQTAEQIWQTTGNLRPEQQRGSKALPDELRGVFGGQP